MQETPCYLHVTGSYTRWKQTVAYRGEGGFRGGIQPPSPQISKALQNRAKQNPIVKTVTKLMNL